MNSNEKRLRNLKNSRFEHAFILPWEHAFNKFGFYDGGYCMTDYVVEVLEEDDKYDVQSKQWGLHNEIIISITKDGQELMPTTDSNIAIGYSDPRDYLPIEIIQLLDERFYD